MRLFREAIASSSETSSDAEVTGVAVPRQTIPVFARGGSGHPRCLIEWQFSPRADVVDVRAHLHAATAQLMPHLKQEPSTQSNQSNQSNQQLSGGVDLDDHADPADIAKTNHLDKKGRGEILC